MNPDTQLTADQLQVICARHGIKYRSHERLTAGFTHEVHRLNSDLVIKLYNPKWPQKYQTELAMLSADQAIAKPKLIASHENDADTDRSYVIMSFVPGVSLGSHWHQATNKQRERLIQSIAKTLQAINKVDPIALTSLAPKGWEEIVVQKARDCAQLIRAKEVLDEQTLQKALRIIRDGAAVLKGSKLQPVYWDIHFDNFIVNDRFELQAIIDLENVELAALDYPLFVVRKMIREPEKFLREADESFANIADYAQLETWYRKYYPEMFAFDNFDARVRLYELLDVLHLMIEWSHIQSLHDKLIELTS